MPDGATGAWRFSTPVLVVVAVALGTVACGDQSRQPTTPLNPGQTPEATAAARVANARCIPDEAERSLTSEQFRAALYCAVTDFTWPTNRFPDIEWIMGAEQNSPYAWTYQIGLEHTQLGGINQCAWYMTWLEARRSGDAELEQEALKYMTDVIPNFAEVVPGYPLDGKSGGTIQRDREVAEVAGIGDPSRVQQFVDNHCATIPFLAMPPKPIADQL